MKRLSNILILASLLVSCSTNDPSTPDEPSPAVPEAAKEAPLTLSNSRSSDENLSAEEVAEALGNQFAVTAWKNNSHSPKEFVLSKDSNGNSPYIVTYTTATGWDYTVPTDQYLKYWDLSARDYTFYAIANYPTSQTTFANGLASINDIDVTKDYAPKLMESYYRRDGAALQDYDMISNPGCDPAQVHYTPTAKDGTPAYADIVPLPFHYLLSQVQFKIYNKAPQLGPSIPISHVTIKIFDDDGYYTTGNYTNLGFETTDTDALTTDFVDKDLTDTTIQSSKLKAITLYQSVVLPQSLSIKAHVIITTDTGMISGTVDLTPGWDKGKIYTYYLYTEYSEDYILVDTVKIDDWIAGPEIEDTQTNW